MGLYGSDFKNIIVVLRDGTEERFEHGLWKNEGDFLLVGRQKKVNCGKYDDYRQAEYKVFKLEDVSRFFFVDAKTKDKPE